MKVKELVKQLDLQVRAGSNFLEKRVIGGYTSDLLSDVMGNACENQVWITMQSHKNIVAVASLKELSAIIISGNRLPAQDTIEQAEHENIPLLTSKESTFELSGKIYTLLYEKVQS